MDLLRNLDGLDTRFAAGTASEDDVHSAYSRVVPAVPRETLADGIAHAFRSDRTPPFQNMVSNLYGQSDPNQKAGLLNQILGALGPNAANILESTGLAGLLRGSRVTPQDAQQVSPQTVQVLAGEAEKRDPTIVDRAAGFYAEHPTLVKALGVGALALLMSRMSRR